MNWSDLSRLAEREGIVPRAYSLEVDRVDNQYVLGRQGLSWTVYYYQRGQKLDERVFRNEDEACVFLLDELRRDPTTRRR